MIGSFSRFAAGLTTETAFDVLAVARRLRAAGKDVIELQIGDSPFPTPPHALAAAHTALDADQTHYGPSLGLPEFRTAIAQSLQRDFGLEVTAEQVAVGAGAKIFQTFFCEAFLEAGDAVLIYEPAFPTYVPNVLRRGAVPVVAPLRPERGFRPDPHDLARFLHTQPRAKAVFLNSPHNPTGSVLSPDDLLAFARLLHDTPVWLFSDEPYCHMVWQGRHISPLSLPELRERTVAVYTFSKSYSMSGWRCGFAVAPVPVIQVLGKLLNTSLSCVPPFVQRACQAALEQDGPTRDQYMHRFRTKVDLLVRELNRLEGITVTPPAGTFYVFADVRPICQRLGITSHGLAMYLLEGADDRQGLACLGGECFGASGQGFLRFSCAEP
ncbi:MAG: aminotransferase class I/II-fold pyridoxal phosphate-dependent enzyme, partial [Gemmataceae bacterium]|nr:aminotransferase class I/II-fold pyridoxal phosphate-dependent enzyme [Gemmataceae bacterium]